MSARTDLENVYSRYAWGFCMDEFDVLSECFSERAEVIFPDGHQGHGHAAVMEKLTSLRQRFRGGWITIPNVFVYEESAETARTRAIYVTVGGDPGATAVGSFGWYEDTFANEGGTWRIVHRIVHPGSYGGS